MEFTASPKPQLSSRANAFSIAALMSSGGSKEKESSENTIKPLGKSAAWPPAVGRSGELRVRPPRCPGLRGSPEGDPQVTGPKSGGRFFPLRPTFSLGASESETQAGLHLVQAVGALPLPRIPGGVRVDG